MPKSSLNDADKRRFKAKLLTTADLANDPAASMAFAT
jgi:hypothetical protein